MMLSRKPKILYLWSEVTGYVLSTIDVLQNKFDADVNLVYWDEKNINSVLFKFENTNNLHKRSDLNNTSLLNLIEQINPQIIVISGWMDKDYVKISIKYKKKFPNTKIVFGIDGIWLGNLRQIFGSIYFKLFFKEFIDYFWVSGKPQYSYAQKFGYNLNNIISNLYSANVNLFKTNLVFTKRFVFVGRFASIKALDILVDAYSSTPLSFQKNWPLVLIGDGEMKNYILNKKNINIILLPFLQPKELQIELSKGGVGCLASHKDNWGVVIHEFTSLGYPLLISDGCGASTEFLISGYNGFLFEKNNINSLINAMLKFSNLSDRDLKIFSERSIQLSTRINPELSAASLLSII